ncbi:MAG: hypothetical protein KAU31_02285, partial [Spirochaetaceae bacterium]|nr:hypothetical protein [Spirochaetaceae bacterium]
EGDNRPGQAEECYVFPLVSDGSASVNTNLLAFKPHGATNTWKNVGIGLYDTPWSSWNSSSGGINTPGELYTFTTRTLAAGDTCGIRVSADWWDNDVPVAFRLAPDHVTDLPAGMIPNKLPGQDYYEPNNYDPIGGTVTAYELPASKNPLFGFVTIWVDYSTDQNDYFTFDVP